MWPYWTLFAFFSLAAITSAGKPPEQRSRFFSAFTFVLISLFVGLRFDVGADWDGYIFIYERLTRQAFELRGDFAFHMLLSLSRWLGADIWLPNLVLAVIFAGGLVVFARRQANFALVIAVAIPYLIIAVAMSGVRQAAALGILLIAFTSFANGRYLSFVLLVLLASTFHASAALMLGVGLIANTRGKFRTLLVTLPLLPIAYLLLSSNFDVYIDRYSDDRVQSGGALIRLVMNAIPAAIFLLNARAFEFSPQTTALWRVISLAAVGCMALLPILPSSTALDRLAIYLIPIQLVVFSRLPFLKLRWLPSQNLGLLLVLLVYGLALFVFFNLGVTSAEWLPYRTWFDQGR